MATVTDPRQKDAERKRKERALNKLVEIPKCKDKKRRSRLEKDDIKWLMWYFGDGCIGCAKPFWYDFTDQQLEMINAIAHAIRYGGDQSIAASRGEGKSTLARRLLLKYVIQGEVDFAVIFAATGPMATDMIASIKDDIETNERLHEDYPEVCVPVRALENTPQRAQSQIVSGHRHDNGKPYSMEASKFSWCGNEIRLPDVPGSPSAKGIIATRGLDAAVRGLNKLGKRPRLAVIDDPDTESTARSADQSALLESRIDAGIGGLGDQQRPIARVMLTTLQSRISASFRFTSVQDKPTWRGKRFRYLEKAPERTDLWDEYVHLRQEDFVRFAEGETDDPFCRRSHQYYMDRRKEMDAGAAVANQHRFDPTELPDGSQAEVSALQHYYNEIARIGAQAVATEYDNDPPELDESLGDALEPRQVQMKVSGYGRGVVPPGCVALTQGIDCRKVALHWVVRAWRPDCTSFVIDYGVEDVTGTTIGSDQGVEAALVRAVRNRFATIESEPYSTIDGDPVPLNLTILDAGWMTSVIYQICEMMGPKVKPAMGFGASAGAVKASFDSPVKTTKDRKPGDGWFLKRQRGQHWLICSDADRWKNFEHARWLTPIDKPGTAMLWGVDDVDGGRLSLDQRNHQVFADQITAESEIEEIFKGQLRRRWKTSRSNNHWLDAAYMTCVAANMLGVRLLAASGQEAAPKLTPAQKKTQVEAGVESQKTDRQPQLKAAPNKPSSGEGWFASQQKRKRR